MINHTPGPWTVDGEYVMATLGNDPGESFAIAECWDYPDMAFGEAVANARLMAAAPDMLKALQAIAAAEIQWEEGLDANIDWLKSIARHAIAEIEGGE